MASEDAVGGTSTSTISVVAAPKSQPTLCRTLLGLLLAGIPVVIQQTCILLLSVRTVARVGHTIGTGALAGVALGNLTYNLLGLTLIMAPMIALETYASQAWGAKRKAEVGLNAQRSLLVAAMLLVPAAVAWLFAEPILRTLGQTEEVSRLAARYLRGMLPVLPVQVAFESAKRFLYAQTIMWPPVLAAVVAVLVHLLCLGPIVDALQFDGAACSLLVAHGCMLLTLLLYILVRRPHDAATWPGWRLCQVARDGRGMKSFIQTSLAGRVCSVLTL